jgi:hypothetical protein
VLAEGVCPAQFALPRREEAIGLLQPAPELADLVVAGRLGEQ